LIEKVIWALHPIKNSQVAHLQRCKAKTTRLWIHDENIYCIVCHNQGRTGHITRWEKSHGAPEAIGGSPASWLFFFRLNLWKFSVWAAAMALYSSYLMTFFFSAILFRGSNILFFLGAPWKKKFPTKSGEPIHPWPKLPQKKMITALLEWTLLYITFLRLGTKF
jgi:hypothetical protein